MDNIKIRIESKINKIVRMRSSKNVELIGEWIWADIPNPTFFNKVTLFFNGFKYSYKQKRWYYPGTSSGYSGRSLEKTKEKYGFKKYK
jgi:hypothetical protein